MLMTFLRGGNRGLRTLGDLSCHREQVAKLGGDLGSLARRRPCPSPPSPGSGDNITS